MRVEWLDNITGDNFGGKAEGLLLLRRNGFQVPECFCIEIAESIEAFDSERFRDELKEYVSILGNGLAIRSSSLVEDLSVDSKAGHFLTLIGTFDFEELIDAIKKVYQSGPSMGVVVQRRIKADTSGVIFTSHPVTYSKRHGLLSCVKGMGEELVNGSKKSDDYEIDYSNLQLADPLLRELCQKVKLLEANLGYPLDIEWTIKGDVLFFLQCRPIANITSIESGLYMMKNIQSLPPQLRSHAKIMLRLEAEKKKTCISDAYVYVLNNSIIQTENFEIVKNAQSAIDSIIPRNQLCKGYSVVVIYPERILNRVVRSFVGNEPFLCQSSDDCSRYEIESYPEYKNLEECLKDFQSQASINYWVVAIIIQELFDAVYTGIIRQINDEYIIEITRGHFLTKGNVSTSQYVVKDKSVHRYEICQKFWYRIIQGHVIKYIGKDEQNFMVSLSDSEIIGIVDSFENIISKNKRVIEFGLVRYGDNLQPYLIDYITSKDTIKTSDIGLGIISSGFRQGRIMNIHEVKDSFNLHFYDKRENVNKKTEDIIFVCDKPDIGLLTLLDQYDNDHIGFSFSDGSILCHLAVVLRERGIPAVKIGNSNFQEGEEYILDAITPGLTGEERMIHV